MFYVMKLNTVTNECTLNGLAFTDHSDAQDCASRLNDASDSSGEGFVWTGDNTEISRGAVRAAVKLALNGAYGNAAQVFTDTDSVRTAPGTWYVDIVSDDEWHTRTRSPGFESMEVAVTMRRELVDIHESMNITAWTYELVYRPEVTF